MIALPDGNVWINTTGSPSMATGGTGDILTGMISGMIAQFPSQIDTAVRAAVWLHGRAGHLGGVPVLGPLIKRAVAASYLRSRRHWAHPNRIAGEHAQKSNAHKNKAHLFEGWASRSLRLSGVNSMGESFSTASQPPKT